MTAIRLTDRTCLHALIAPCVVILVGLAAPASATVVLPMTVNTLADHAGQVIAGRVVSVRSYWADNPRRIESEVTLEQVEHLKGPSGQRSDSFTLVVPGGTVGDMQMHIGCGPTFRVSEKWLLFLLPSYKTFPVVGVSQGAFRVRPDADGLERVYNAAAEPVIGIDGRGYVRVGEGRAERSNPTPIGMGNVRAVRAVSHTEPRVFSALTYQEFVAGLRSVLADSRDHHLRQPAGQRIPVQYTPVPMRSSSAEAPGFNAQTDRAAETHSLHRSKPLRVLPGDRRTARHTRGALR